MKKILLTMGIIIALTLPMTAFASPSATPAAKNAKEFRNENATKITEQKKVDAADACIKMMRVKIESIRKSIKNGTITKVQGKADIKKLIVMIKDHKKNGVDNCLAMPEPCMIK